MNTYGLVKLLRDNGVEALKTAIRQNPQILFAAYGGYEYYKNFFEFLAMIVSDLEFDVFLCELLDQLVLPPDLSKRQYLEKILLRRTEISFYAEDEIVHVVTSGNIPHLTYVLARLGAELWDCKFYGAGERYESLFEFISTIEMLEFLIATHSDKERVLLKLTKQGTSNFFSDVISVFPISYMVKFLQEPAIRALCELYVRNFSHPKQRFVLELFHEEERLLLQYFPADNSLLGVIGRILGVERKRHKDYHKDCH